MVEPLGPKIRRQRRRLGLTLDELSGRTGISKPYLSLIETGRVSNPPRDEKLRRLEQTLGFTAGELLTQAHLQRTPRDVRELLERLMREGSGDRGEEAEKVEAAGGDRNTAVNATDSSVRPALLIPGCCLMNMGDASAVSSAKALPVINRIAAGYSMDFTDPSGSTRKTDEYVSCPDLNDGNAFAARVHGDSMTPKFREGDIVIFSPALAPREGDDCFVRFQDGQATFKRVFFESGEGGASVLRLQPRNERYRPQGVPSDKVTGLYRAVYRYQRVDEEREDQ